MNKKLTIADLVDGLCRRTKLAPEEAAPFVQEMFQLIVEALATDKLVKVRGLGTFKLLSVDDRESMNVNTGERIVIPGHDKMTFTPDTVMRDEVNKPFADFESVELNDETPLDAMLAMDEKEVAAPADEAPAPLQPEAPADEAPQTAVAEESQAVVTEEAPQPAVADEAPLAPAAEMPQAVAAEEPAQPAAKAEEAQPAAAKDEPQPVDDEPLQPVEDEQPQPVACEQPQPAEQQVSPEAEPVAQEKEAEHVKAALAQPIHEAEAPASQPEGSMPEPGIHDQADDVPAKKRSYWWLVALALLVALGLGYLGGSKCTNQPVVEQEEAEQQPAQQKAEQAAADSLAQKAEQADEAQQWPQVEGGEFLIVGEIGKDTMTVGKNLLRISKRHYGSDKYVDYICVMNGIANPDIVPLNMELKLPKLKRKQQ